jgi:hypothetical protein
MANREANDFEFEEARPFCIGGVDIFFTTLTVFSPGFPVVHAAAFEERDFKRYWCGFGASEAEAAADLLRLVRD